MKILIDNGHGEGTAGKRSPIWADGSQLFEWKYTREIAVMLKEILQENGVEDVELIAPGNDDLSLSQRTKKVNSIVSTTGAASCLLISIHCNAAGDGTKPMTARGWSVYISHNASKNSKDLANCFCDVVEEINKPDIKLRAYSQKQKYWIENFAICRDTKCPAVLTENLFMDNEADCKFLLSEKGKKEIVFIHYHAIKKYIDGKDNICECKCHKK